MGWEFGLAIGSFGLLLLGWAVLPMKDNHTKTETQTISPSKGRDLPHSYQP